MQRLLAPLVLFFVIIIVLASCKSQKQLTSAPQPIITLDSLTQLKEDTAIAEVAAPDTLEVVEIEQPIVPTKKDSIIIIGVGDIMLGTNFPETYYLPPNQGRDMLTGIAPIFGGADIVFGNLEGVLLD